MIALVGNPSSTSFVAVAKLSYGGSFALDVHPAESAAERHPLCGSKFHEEPPRDLCRAIFSFLLALGHSIHQLYTCTRWDAQLGGSINKIKKTLLLNRPREQCLGSRASHRYTKHGQGPDPMAFLDSSIYKCLAGLSKRCRYCFCLLEPFSHVTPSYHERWEVVYVSRAQHNGTPSSC